nr:HD-Zip IV transcription factor [Spirogyra pratensis]
MSPMHDNNFPLNSDMRRILGISNTEPPIPIRSGTGLESSLGRSASTSRLDLALNRIEDYTRKRETEHVGDNEQQLSLKGKEDENDSRSESDGDGDGDGGSNGYGDDNELQPNKKGKKYHRHTAHQIHEMEMLFKECPHPDEKQRAELSKALGLEPRQVKFWFQNRRTQMKTQGERAENSVLKSENERLRAENSTLREALKCATCPQCGSSVIPGPPSEQSTKSLRLIEENTRLKSEIERLTSLAAKHLTSNTANGKEIIYSPLLDNTRTNHDASVPRNFLGKLEGSDTNFPPLHDKPFSLTNSQAPDSQGDKPSGRLTDTEKEVVYDLATVAMEELVQLARSDGSVWIHGNGGQDILNADEYNRRFGNRFEPVLGLNSEGSRASGVVMAEPLALTETFLNPNKWIEMFSCIISRAVIVETVSFGASNGNPDGTLQLMYSEIQLLSPLVSSRETFFLRYCKKLADGCWAIADISADSLRDNPPPVMLRCRRKASGCIIEEISNGCCNVTFLEHMEVEDRFVHILFQPFVESGTGYGALRWLSTLQRNCIRASIASNPITTSEWEIPSPSGRHSLMRLSCRMMNSFHWGSSSTTQHAWMPLTLAQGEVEDVRIMTRKSFDNLGEPHGIILSAATSMWLPANRQRIFNYLLNDKIRSEWDILANGGFVSEMGCIRKEQDVSNSISLLKVHSPAASPNDMIILQETVSDASMSMMVYAPVDVPAIQLIFGGGDPDFVALLPSGFAIFPDCASPSERLGMYQYHLRTNALDMNSADSAPVPFHQVTDASLLTIAFQILVSSLPQSKLSMESIATVNSLVSCTMQRIRSALLNS